VREGRGLGPVMYGALFVVALPVVLVLWARATEQMVLLPTYRVPWLGGVLVGSGFALCLAGMHALRRHGRGLPMNAYPPPVYVTRGVYRFVRHPIYLGFASICFGAALFFGSASGLWLVSPVASLGAVALVLGYERHDLRRRFGAETLRPPLFTLPRAGDQRPTAWDRASIFIVVFLPWAVAYEAVFRLGVPMDAVSGFLSFERAWPVWIWTETFYASVYVFVGAVPFIARQTGVLRHFGLTGLVATAVVTLIYLTVPVVAPPRPFVAEGILGRMLELQRSMSHTVAAFPAFHVIWTLTAAEAWARTFPRVAVGAWLWALAISVSCITTGMHALADVVLAGALWPLLRSYRWAWERLRGAAETVANSWRQWRLGPVRIINHGFYAGAGGGIGAWIALSLAGPEARVSTLIIFGSGLFGAALWAQRLEGSSALSRPFGYFGSVFGCVGGAVAVTLAGLPALLPLTATAVAAPWIQALGRFRCLVQGCCHGSPADECVGIRYNVPNSRVVSLARLGHRPIHPAPLYSILANVVVGVLLARLWWVGAPQTLIVGVYLLLTGIGRFIEESYRGEPQTPIVGGLRLYQWTAIAMTVAGMTVSSVTSAGALPASGWLAGETLIGAAAFGVATLLAMGVDFPESTRRYARLSG
jgi:protein-S-isoprenylcysteine O-methyltransferase Ste14